MTQLCKPRTITSEIQTQLQIPKWDVSALGNRGEEGNYGLLLNHVQYSKENIIVELDQIFTLDLDSSRAV